MIVGFFLQIFYSIIHFFVDLLPVIAYPEQIDAAAKTAWGLINAFSYIFPVSTLAQVLGVALVFHGTVLVWRMSNWVLHLLRGH